jgi:hypothetical protein
VSLESNKFDSAAEQHFSDRDRFAVQLQMSIWIENGSGLLRTLEE